MSQQPPKDGDAPVPDSTYAAASSALPRYLECVEQFFPFAAAKLSLTLHQEHAADVGKYLPEELEAERIQLQQQLRGPIARAIRGSALVVLYSAFESTVLDAARELASTLKLQRFEPDPQASFFAQANHQFKAVFDVNLFSSAAERDVIDRLRLLRNSFIHNQSSVDRLRPGLKDSIRAATSPHTKCLIDGGTWIPTVDCINAYGNSLRYWAHTLSQRVIGRIGPENYL